MLKGGMFTTYFLIFIGSIIVSLVLVYMLFYGGLGIASSMIYYDTRANVEVFTGLVSAASSHNGDFRIVFSLPPGKCELEVSQDKVRMKIPQGDIKIESQEIKVKMSETTMSIVKPDYVNIGSFKTSCSETEKRMVIIEKIENEVRFSEK
jgi:hypothetical protein